MTAPDLPLDAAALDERQMSAHNLTHAEWLEVCAQARAALALREELEKESRWAARMSNAELVRALTVNGLADEVDALKAELAESDRTRDMLASICKRTAVALKGPEPDMGLHDWSDLPDVAAKLVDELAECRVRATYWYESDGTVTTHAPEVVVRRRMDAARELAECRAVNTRWQELEASLCPEDFGFREVIESLRAKLALESEARNVAGNLLAETQVKLAQAEQERGDAQFALKETDAEFRTALAASQANVRELREALRASDIGMCAVGVKHPREHEVLCDAVKIVRSALARPVDDSALREILTKMGERCKETSDANGPLQSYDILEIRDSLLGGGK